MVWTMASTTMAGWILLKCSPCLFSVVDNQSETLCVDKLNRSAYICTHGCMDVCMHVCVYVCMDEQTEAARASTYLEQTTAPSFKGTGPCNQPSCDVELNVITWLRPPHSLPRPLDGPWDHWTDHWTDQGTIGPTIGRSNHWTKAQKERPKNAQIGRAWIEQACIALGWLAG